ncbi:MAG: GNAT family N-acetyltransferase, partial [Vibrio casei]
MWLKEVELESNTVKLIPLQREHADDLVAAASDGRLWDLWYTSVPNAETIEAYLAFAFQEQERGASLAFTVLDKSTNKVI